MARRPPAWLWDDGTWVPSSLLVMAGVRRIEPTPSLPNGIRRLPANITLCRAAFEAAGILTPKNEGRLWRRLWRGGAGGSCELHVDVVGSAVHARVRDYCAGLRARYGGAPRKETREWATAQEIAALRIDGLPLDPKEIGEMLGRHLDRASEGWAWRKRVSRPVTPMTVEYNMFLYVREVVEGQETRGRPSKWR